MLSLEVNSKKQNQHAEKSRNLEKSKSGNILDIRDHKLVSDTDPISLFISTITSR